MLRCMNMHQPQKFNVRWRQAPEASWEKWIPTLHNFKIIIFIAKNTSLTHVKYIDVYRYHPSVRWDVDHDTLYDTYDEVDSVGLFSGAVPLLFPVSSWYPGRSSYISLRDHSVQHCHQGASVRRWSHCHDLHRHDMGRVNQGASNTPWVNIFQTL